MVQYLRQLQTLKNSPAAMIALVIAPQTTAPHFSPDPRRFAGAVWAAA
jgi:hypothetical protein